MQFQKRKQDRSRVQRGGNLKNIKTISIKCDCKDLLKLEDMTVMQGGLKERTKTDYEKIKKSILTYSFSFPFFIWQSGKTNWLIDGTGRYQTLCKMQKDGYIIPPLPVVYIQCKNKTEAKQKLLRLNSQYGKMTKESVLEFAEDIDLNFDEIALPDSVIDFSDGEEAEEGIETKGDEEIPEEQEEIVSKYGEVYELGNSLLICGSCTDEEIVKKLFNGEKADISFTSPPYNMGASFNGIGGKLKSSYMPNKQKNAYEGSGTNDSKDDEEYTELLCKSLELALKYCDDVMFNIGILKGSKSGIINMLTKFRDNFCELVFWKKGNSMPFGLESMKGKVSHRVEPIFCFNNSGNTSFSHSQWDKGTGLNIIETNTHGGGNEYAKIHHATFPVEFAESVIKLFSEKSVYEPFCGTGTTLIACEKHNRKCYSVELSPKYCDVIRRRYTKWAKENGKPITSGCLE